MLIDWFTVLAQAINFLILVWLLKRFLYKPVLAAIDAREKKVAAKLGDAAALETKAQAEREDLRQRSEALDHERGDVLRKATDEANVERQRLIESARQDSQLLRSKLTQALSDERAALGHQLSVRTQAEVFAVARKTLADLAGVSLEDRMIEVFIARLRDLPQAQLPSGTVEVVVQPAATGDALVRSAFDLPAAGRASIEAAIHERLGPNVTIRFETSAETVCGIELTVDGVKLAWSVANYLSSLAQVVTNLTVPESAARTESPAPSPPPEEAVHAA
jgi:F-type H+-transporting ATPase subunit b